MDEQETGPASWQASRVSAAAGKHPVLPAVAARLTSLMEVEMMAKQLSSGELDRITFELLATTEEPSE